jgi:XTP/dITP diphosphohydrolase
MSLPDLIVASNNQGKIREIKYALDDQFGKILSLKEAGIHISPEETGKNYLENALIKAKAAAGFWEGWILSDDSGLEVDALNGGPGIYSSRFSGENATDERNNAKLLNILKDVPENKRTARFRCIVVLYDGKTGKTISAEGTCEGIITTSPKGTNGFGFDPLFYILQLGRTMAELTFEEKMQISHRANALKELKSKLRYL